MKYFKCGFGGFDSAQPPYLYSATVSVLSHRFNFCIHFGGFDSAQPPYLCSATVLIFVFTSVTSVTERSRSHRFNTMTEQIFHFGCFGG